MLKLQLKYQELFLFRRGYNVSVEEIGAAGVNTSYLRWLTLPLLKRLHLILRLRKYGVALEILFFIYTVSQKKGATLIMAITLLILGGFAKFSHCWKDQ